ncbi:MAG: transposase [Candidatus Thermoplasmatota archaeon]|nr:transposase [Candidatus Thermoplasmatota archaeon]MBU1915017.1 transposase [Candidatus Thermoplasmatota archaeon]
MVATEMELPREVFSFSGQTRMDTFSLDIEGISVDFDRYDDVAIHGLRLAMEAIRRHADEFPFWQRRRRMGRPGTDERTLLIAFMLQQLLSLTFRETEGVLALVRVYYSVGHVPDHSTMARKLSSRRWSTLLDRFFEFLIAPLPRREAVVVTDATGYSGRKRAWRATKHAQRAVERWTKAHVAIEMDWFVILSFRLTNSNVHESQVFEAVWSALPDNVVPIRSLADSAYMGNDCLAVARRHGATPLHKIKRNAKDYEEPETFYQKLVNFAHHWPNRFAVSAAKRSHVETVFSMVDSLLGYRLRCRTRRGRRNEVRTKYCLFNMVQLAMTPEFWSA